MARLLDRIRGHQENITRLLEAHAKNRLAGTLLFSGPSGIGKRLSSLGLAQALVCEKGETACGLCGPCLRVEKGQSESLLMIEPSGGSIKIEQAREILQFIQLRKLGKARVIVIDQAHLMNQQTANALLKSLEEPPAGTYFILITPLAASVLATIRSRAQMVRFRPLTSEELNQILERDLDPWILEASHGSVEMALHLSESREEYAEIEEALRLYLSAALEGVPVQEVAKLKELIKERSAQTFAAGLMQNLFAGALRKQAGLGIERLPKAWHELALLISSWRPDQLDQLSEGSLGLEAEMARNVDRGLLLENFAIGIKRANEQMNSINLGVS